MPERYCNYCHKFTRCKHCSCRQAWYCNRDCQAAHWRWHKLVCTAPTEREQVGRCNFCSTFKRCKRCPCKAVLYCSRECQERDWPEHELVCRRPKRTNSQGEAQGQVEDTPMTDPEDEVRDTEVDEDEGEDVCTKDTENLDWPQGAQGHAL